MFILIYTDIYFHINNLIIFIYLLQEDESDEIY